MLVSLKMDINSPITDLPPELKQFGEHVLYTTIIRAMLFDKNGSTDHNAEPQLSKSKLNTSKFKAKRLNNTIYDHVMSKNGAIGDYLYEITRFSVMLDPSKSIGFEDGYRSSPVAALATNLRNRILKRNDTYIDIPRRSIEEQIPELFAPNVGAEHQEGFLRAINDHLIPWRFADIYAAFTGSDGPDPIIHDLEWMYSHSSPLVETTCTDDSYKNPVTVLPDSSGELYCVDLDDLAKRFAKEEYVNPITGDELNDETIENIKKTYKQLIEEKKALVVSPKRPSARRPSARLKKTVVPLPDPLDPPKLVKDVPKRTKAVFKFEAPKRPTLETKKITQKDLGALKLSDPLAKNIYIDRTTEFFKKYITDDTLDMFIHDMYEANSKNTLKKALYQIELLNILMTVPEPPSIKKKKVATGEILSSFNGRKFGELTRFLKAKVKYGVYGGEKLASLEFDEAFPELSFSSLPEKKSVKSGIERLARSAVETALQHAIYRLNPSIRRTPVPIPDSISIKDINLLADESSMCSNVVDLVGGMEDLVICDQDGTRVCYSINELTRDIIDGKVKGLGADFVDKVRGTNRQIGIQEAILYDEEEEEEEEVVPVVEEEEGPRTAPTVGVLRPTSKKYVPSVTSALPRAPTRKSQLPPPKSPEPVNIMDVLEDIRRPAERGPAPKRTVPKRKWKKLSEKK
jgi:hypothetical protein